MSQSVPTLFLSDAPPLTSGEMSSVRSDAELLDALRAGDVTAFDALFLRYHAGLCSFAYHYINSEAIAEELAQDTLLFLWNRRATLDVSAESLPRYLFASVRNAAVSQLRRRLLEERSTDAIVALSAAPAQADHDAEEAELAAAVRRAVAQLPDRCRAVFALHREQGMTYNEVARILDISPKTVENHMGRAFKLLRKSLAPYWKTQ